MLTTWHFFSLQTDVTLVAKENRRELLAAVQKCWEEYPIEKMESVWSCLYGSFSGILETGGDNDSSAIVEVALLTVSALSMATSTTS